MTNHDSVADLVRSAANGSADSWAELVDRFAATVIAIARQYRLGEADVDDVAQVVWLRLAENLRKIRQPERLAGWLASTARNESLRVLKRRALVDPLYEIDIESPVPGAGVQLVHKEAVAEVAGRFAMLDERCRVLLHAVVVDQQDYAEVADRLSIPIGSIGPTRRRCLEKLRTLLADPTLGCVEPEVVT